MKTQLTDENYCCEVIRIDSLLDIEGFNNLKGVSLYGFLALVPKTTQIGDTCLLFTAESCLSEAYCFENNLFRTASKNKDTEKKGYIEDSRRIKAIKMKGVISSALIMPLSSLPGSEDLKLGTRFNKVDGEELVKKYELDVRTPGGRTGAANASKKDKIPSRFFPKHFDTAQYAKNKSLLESVGGPYYVTQKLHGTSARFANVACPIEINRWQKFKKWLGFDVKDSEFITVCGSRNRDLRPADTHSFHSDESGNVWEHCRKKLIGKIPKNYVIFGEIVGYWGDKEIQKGYSYGYPKGQCELYVYRVAQINPDGVMVDLGWTQVKAFCDFHQIKYVPELTVLTYFEVLDIFLNSIQDCKLKDTAPQCLPVDSVDEGVCVRSDNKLTPVVLKSKFPKFLLYETGQLDKGVVDMESIS